jgi:hypothetical protein
MAARKKAEGIAQVLEQEHVSIQDITMLDWYAAFSLLGGSGMHHPKDAAREAFDKAEAMMAERANRL